MTPVLINKNVESWKSSTNLVCDSNSKNVGTKDLPLSFIANDGNIYYIIPELVNIYQPSQGVNRLLQNESAIHNGNTSSIGSNNMMQSTTMINNYTVTGSDCDHESFSFSKKLDGMVNNDIQAEISCEISNSGSSNSELKRLIKLQFEYYFCRENLANDSYLVSQMDSERYVNISTIAKFNQVRRLTSDMSVIIEALQESPYVQLDETSQKVRANIKRCIVMLREIPKSTPIDELKNLFSHPNCPKWVSFEFAHNDNWYVTFNSEEDAKKAYRYLHEEVQTFHGRPLMARIKAKTLMSRTNYLPKNAVSPVSLSCNSTSVSSVVYTTFQTSNTFVVPSNTIFHQTPGFQFYAAPFHNSPVLPGLWIRPRPTALFLQHDTQPNFDNDKQNSNFQFATNRGCVQNRNYFKKSKGHSSHSIEESSKKFTPHMNYNSNNLDGKNFIFYKRNDERYIRGSSNFKRDFRTNVVESPRFQRLRERRNKEDIESKSSESVSVKTMARAEISLDLATENFPALPISNISDASTNKTTSSLKELASYALQKAQQHSVGFGKNSGVESSLVGFSNKISLVEKLESSSRSSTFSGNESLVAPKMSYAQMAQKLNKTYLESNNGNITEIYVDKNIMINSTIDYKEKDNPNTVKTSNYPLLNHEVEKLSPKWSTVSKYSSGVNIGSLCTDELDEIKNVYPQTSKETYASRFGKTASAQEISSKADTSSVPQNVTKINVSCTYNTWADVSKNN